MVYHDEVSNSGADSFAVLIPTSLVEATFQELIAVVDMSKAVAAGRMTKLVDTNNSGNDHREAILHMFIGLVAVCRHVKKRRLKLIYILRAWEGGMLCNVKVSVVNATPLEVTRG